MSAKRGVPWNLGTMDKSATAHVMIRKVPHVVYGALVYYHVQAFILDTRTLSREGGRGAKVECNRVQGVMYRTGVLCTPTA